MNGLTPFQSLVVWVGGQLQGGTGSIPHGDYHAAGNALGCPAPGQNAAFGTRYPSMVRTGGTVTLTTEGWNRVARYRAAAV